MNRMTLMILVVLGSGFLTVGQRATAAEAATPALDCLPKFTAADVPATGPAEIPAEPSLNQLVKTDLVPANLPGKGLAQHPMLYIGEGYNAMLLVNNGKVIWTYSTGKGWEYDDIWMLSNGNILFSRMQYAEEITPQKKVAWHFDAPKGAEIHTVQPIGLDKVVFMINAVPKPKVMVINKKTGAVEVEHEMDSPNPDGKHSGVHGQTRRMRVTASGTYLIPWLGLGKVVEYDTDFKEIWSYSIPSPWAAIRLHNGNTLISDEKDKLAREVNAKGETVWEFKLSELPPEIPFIDSQTCVRLANGNTIFCSRGSGGKGCQLVEITPDKKVVWALHDWKNLGPATAVQILEDPGIPEKPGDLQR